MREKTAGNEKKSEIVAQENEKKHEKNGKFISFL
jgi:hypothetical protein